MNTKPTVLFLFNSSSYASAPWVEDGRFNVVHVDYDETDHSGAHTGPVDGVLTLNVDLSLPDAHRRVLELLWSHSYSRPSFVVSFSPCTDLAVCGAKHFASKLEKDPDCQNKAVKMAKVATLFECPYIIENPISMLSTLWRKPDLIVHPHSFSGYIAPEDAQHPEFPEVLPPRDQYKKKTCLWLGNGAARPLLDSRPPLEKDFPGFKKLGGKSARTKYIRSLTPRGMARAIYWANYPIILQKVVDKAYLKGLLSLKRSTLDVLI